MSTHTDILKTEKGWLIKIVSIIGTISLAISSYYLTQTATTLKELDGRVQRLELRNVYNETSLVTTKEFYMYRTEQEKRVLRVEESIPVIKDALLEIKQRLQ